MRGHLEGEGEVKCSTSLRWSNTLQSNQVSWNNSVCFSIEQTHLIAHFLKPYSHTEFLPHRSLWETPQNFCPVLWHCLSASAALPKHNASFRSSCVNHRWLGKGHNHGLWGELFHFRSLPEAQKLNTGATNAIKLLSVKKRPAYSERMLAVGRQSLEHKTHFSRPKYRRICCWKELIHSTLLPTSNSPPYLSPFSKAGYLTSSRRPKFWHCYPTASHEHNWKAAWSIGKNTGFVGNRSSAEFSFHLLLSDLGRII